MSQPDKPNTRAQEVKELYETIERLKQQNLELSEGQQKLLIRNLQLAAAPAPSSVKVEEATATQATSQAKSETAETAAIDHSDLHSDSRSDPKVSHIDIFEGKQADCEDWLTQLAIFLLQQPNRYSSDESKVHYASSRLRGDALKWFRPYLTQPDDPVRTDFRAFTARISSVFGDHNAIRNATRAIRELTQQGACSEYVAKFRHLSCVLVDWTDAILIPTFYAGLKPTIKDTLALQDENQLPKSLVEYMDHCIRIDDRNFARQKERQHEKRLATGASPSPQTQSHSVPPRQTSSGINRIDALQTQVSALQAQLSKNRIPRGTSPQRTKLTEAERAHLVSTNGCFYCRQPNAGHVIQDCPSRPPRPHVTAAAVVLEPVLDDSDYLELNRYAFPLPSSHPTNLRQQLGKSRVEEEELNKVTVDALARHFGPGLVHAFPTEDRVSATLQRVIQERTPALLLITHHLSLPILRLAIRQPVHLTGQPPRRFAVLISGAQPKTPHPIPALPQGTPRIAFPGSVSGQPISFLIDTGCSGNVVSEALVQRLGLETRPAGALDLTFANGNVHRSTHHTVLHLTRGSYSAAVRCYVAPIEEDLILGVPWFESVEATFSWAHGKLLFSVNATQRTHCWWAPGRPSPVLPAPHPTVRCAYVRASTWRGHTRSAVVVGEIRIRPDMLADIREEQPELSNDSVLSEDYLSSLSPDLQGLVRASASIFAQPTGLPPDRPETHRIRLTPDSRPPPWRGVGKLSAVQLAELKKQISSLLEKGFIRPSTSPFGASILFATKADGSLRLCIDYRSLNAITVKDATPLPNISELRDRLGKASIFSAMDCRDGFWNIRVHPEDTHKTAFRCRFGHFEWQVLPFGLTNSPATMMALMNRVFRDLYDDYVVVYMDDILVFSDSLEDHHKHLAEVFRRLQTNNLYLKLKKCLFARPQVPFCGHLVSSAGVSVDPSKISALPDLVAPLTSKKQIQAFLGMCNWFRDFIPAYAEVSQPLSDLTRDASTLQWTPREHSCVLLLIHRILTAPSLRVHDPALPTHVYSDASDYAIGGWLGQKVDNAIHPIVFWSRKLIPAELNYTVHDKECLALHEICKKQEVYLKGNTVFAFTDHKALEHLSTQPSLNQRQTRWVEYLQTLDLQVEYLPGKFNSVADLLSRSPKFAPLCDRCRKPIVCAPVATRSSASALPTTPDLMTLVQDSQAAFLADKSDRLISSLPRVHGLSRHRNLVYVPPDHSLRGAIISSFHDPPSQGHQGIDRTADKVRQLFSWSGMEADVRSFVESCDSCQRNKHRTGPSYGFLQPLQIPFDRFSGVTMDPFFLPKNRAGNDMVLLVVEASVVRNVVLIPCRSTDSAETLAKLFIRFWHDRGFGLPTSFVTDRDSRFTSTFWRGFINAINANHRFATARHQQTDGLSERNIRSIKEVMRHYASTSDWGDLLSSIEFALNNSTSSSTGFTPFYLMYGCHPRTVPYSTPDHLSSHHILRDSVVKARTTLVRHKDFQAIQYDKHHILPPELTTGQLVLLSSEGIKRQSANKLFPLWLGPFPVEKLHPPLNVELSLPKTWRIHPVFHISRVKPYNSPSSTFPSRPPCTFPVEPILVTDEDGNVALEWIVDAILDHKVASDKTLLFLTHWLGTPVSESTWEPPSSFVRPFTQAFLDYLSQLSDSAKRGVRVHWPSDIKKPTSLS
jgi:hypothetical protein